MTKNHLESPFGANAAGSNEQLWSDGGLLFHEIREELPTTRPMTSAMQVGHPVDAVDAFWETILDTELTEMMIEMFVH
jgi:hypothetical protein